LPSGFRLGAERAKQRPTDAFPHRRRWWRRVRLHTKAGVGDNPRDR
jgi:hypothetical protein